MLKYHLKSSGGLVSKWYGKKEMGFETSVLFNYPVYVDVVFSGRNVFTREASGAMARSVKSTMLKLGWDSVGPLPDSSLLFNWSAISCRLSTCPKSVVF